MNTPHIKAWRPVVDYEAKYEVARTGDIRKLDGTPIRPHKNGKGYMMVGLSYPPYPKKNRSGPPDCWQGFFTARRKRTGPNQAFGWRPYK